MGELIAEHESYPANKRLKLWFFSTRVSLSFETKDLACPPIHSQFFKITCVFAFN